MEFFPTKKIRLTLNDLHKTKSCSRHYMYRNYPPRQPESEAFMKQYSSPLGVVGPESVNSKWRTECEHRLQLIFRPIVTN